MRLKSVICWFFAALCGIFCVCERSDVITGAGGSVVSDMDSTLTTERRGFAFIAIEKGAEAVEEAFSLPREADPRFSTHIGLNMFVGINEQGDTLAGQMRFRAKGSADNPLIDHTLDSVMLHFRAISDTAAAAGVPVYSCDTLIWVNPVNRDDTGGSAGEEGGNAKIGDLTIDKGIGALRIPDSIAQKIFNARASSDTAAFYGFAFSIVGYHENVLKLHPPKVIIYAAKDKETVSDTITGASRFTAFENMGDGRASNPYSSHNSKRTAVFKINVSKILDSLKALDLMGGKGELMNAVIAVKHSPEDTANSLASSNIGNYRAVILDALIENEFPSDTTGTAYLRSLDYWFDPSRRQALNTAPTTPYNVHDIKTPLGDVIRKHNTPGASPYIYVYLRPMADNSVILWNNPPKIETVFTPSRSR